MTFSDELWLYYSYTTSPLSTSPKYLVQINVQVATAATFHKGGVVSELEEPEALSMASNSSCLYVKLYKVLFQL
ncbi:unnamed protein product [Phytophthora lilii]|uniref:Unnamed protein product n=1 Tax=Phytophthora lilii TaxID=2077276 RepID=A0A9W7CRX9_9STRA|nr:unnamed protein product [Phytophthora lilii]